MFASKVQSGKGRELLMEIEAMRECLKVVVEQLNSKKKEHLEIVLTLKEGQVLSEIEVTEKCIKRIAHTIEEKQRELDKIQKTEERKEEKEMTAKYKVKAKRVIKCRGQSTINVKVTCGLCGHVYHDWVKVSQNMYSGCPNCDAENEFAMKVEQVELAAVN